MDVMNYDVILVLAETDMRDKFGLDSQNRNLEVVDCDSFMPN